MLKNFLNKMGIQSQANFIKTNGYGYGQVEPNHLSAQGSKEVYAQLPAHKDIEILEQGQFVKYDYAAGVVDFTGAGEWMLVFNEIKLYREEQNDCEFAMIKDNYQARVYSPFGGGLDKDGNLQPDEMWDRQSRYYNGKDAAGNKDITINGKKYVYDDVTAGEDIREIYYNEDPFHILGKYKEKMMPEGTTMVPRVLKTNIGDIYTTNTINETSVEVGDKLYVGDKGLLVKTKKTTANDNGAASGDMIWQVVKVYTMPDHQPGVKVMRIA